VIFIIKILFMLLVNLLMRCALSENFFYTKFFSIMLFIFKLVSSKLVCLMLVCKFNTDLFRIQNRTRIWTFPWMNFLEWSHQCKLEKSHTCEFLLPFHYNIILKIHQYDSSGQNFSIIQVYNWQCAIKLKESS
jgi:hypothetical protein